MSNSSQVHPSLTYSVKSIGQDQQPLIIVENFLSDPHSLVQFASSHCQLTPSNDLYPGIRTHSPPQYLQLIRAQLGDLIASTFKLNHQNVKLAESYLSIVNTPAKNLHPLQRIPHIDGANPNDIAFLHFLCDEKYGGTSFYRHRATGYEFINDERLNNFTQSLEKEFETQGLPEGYTHGTSQFFEKVETCAANFNRLLIYRGTSLHSGDIAENYNYDPNPKTGRLTVTSFLRSAV